ncbi:hypothetical protein BUALT_Bualt09G0007600 [Buddleja alternifolia]|uniref:Pentatricopeptide repeat-containing protein n=1 Tax=Buddleja alternifolia TaxID=168488 RepID=A0AAV6X729_9LAMI|nr:hypothetical protein BUALT_Bualt09G0007600 [Buddleja alternifolia]
MGSLKLEFSLQISNSNSNSNSPRRIISCGLRNGPRKAMWRRSRVLSTEAIQAVQSLKLAQNSSSSSFKLDQVFRNKVNRLLKADLLDTLAELQRQNQLDLALKVGVCVCVCVYIYIYKVFNFVKKEVWYVPDVSLFNDMILMLGKNKMIDMAEQLFLELKSQQGLEPDARTYTEMIGAYFKVEMVNKAVETYELMKASDFEVTGQWNLLFLDKTNDDLI